MKNKLFYGWVLITLVFLGLPITAWAVDSPVGVAYRGHIQDRGDYPLDGSWIDSPEIIGTTGQSKRIEGFEIKLTGTVPGGMELRYNVHVQNKGWLYDEDDSADWPKDGAYAGTRGNSLRIEAVKIVLTDSEGKPVGGYAVQYRGHVQNVGDLPADDSQWLTDGEQLGTVGSSLRLEALLVQVVKTGQKDADLSDYTALLEQLDQLGEADYTAPSWAALQSTITAHPVTVKNSQTEVDAAVAAIQVAYDKLEKKTETNLSTYADLLTKIEKLKQADYTEQSWVALQAVLNKNLVTVENTQAEVDAVVAAIQLAYDKLEKKNVPVEPVVYDKVGTYGPKQGSETIVGDVMVAADGVILQNLVIAGSLTISEAVGSGTVTLNNVTVEGDTLVRGGGVHSIKINGGQYRRIIMEKTASGAVRIVATGVDGLEVVIAEDASGEAIILEGTFESVTVNAPNMRVTTQGNTTTIGTMTVGVGAGGSTVTVAAGTTVSDLVLDGKAAVKGQGTVAKATVKVDGVVFDKRPGTYTVAPGVVIPPVFPTPDSGGGSGGGYTPPGPVVVIGVSLNKTTATLSLNATESLTATVAPAAATNKTVSWSSSNDAIATVDSSGKVTAISEGQATITVISQDGNKSATCKVTVKDLKPAIAGVTVPFAGATPVAAITTTSQLSGAVSWQKKDGSSWTTLAAGAKFDGISSYRATIALTINAPYLPADIPANFFAVAGATATNDAGSLVVTAEFSPTNAFKIDNNGWITAFSGPGGLVEVPAQVNNITVTGIGIEAFKNQTAITAITLPVTVTTIEEAAFSGCSGLTAVTFTAPAGLQTIGAKAFKGCAALTGIAIPDAVKSIKVAAFSGCTKLATVTISANALLERIEGEAFSNCPALTAINIPQQVTYLGDSAFQACGALDTITIAGNLTAIGTYTFAGCQALPAITLPESITSIGYGAFSYCQNLTSIAIPQKVTVLGPYAFDNCLKLETVTFTGTPTLTTIRDYAFNNCLKLRVIEIPMTVTALKSRAFKNCTDLTAITFRGPTPELEAYAIAADTTIRHYGNYSGYDDNDDWTAFTNKSHILATPMMPSANSSYAGAPLVTLTWDLVTDATSYDIFVSTTDGSFGDPLVNVNASTITYVITGGLTSGTTYYFAVKARDAYGESLPSASKSALMPYQYPVESITVSATPATLVVGNTGTLSAAFLPVNASNQTVSWSSADTNIASVDAATGQFTANAEGTAIMTGTTADGGKTGTCQVTVVPDQVTGVTLDQSSLSVGVTKTAQLTATVAPAGVTNQTVNWTSSDENVATVDSTGQITGIKEGSVTITATTAENNFTKTCSVTVTEGYDVSVTDNKATITKYHGENKAVDIPDTIDVAGTPVPVVAIGATAFSKTDAEFAAGDTGITTVTIPASVTSIGFKAFENCEKLTTVSFDSGSQLTTIEGAAFYDCLKLKNIVLPDTVTAIKTSAFASCYALESINLPAGLQTLEQGAFSFCQQLTAVTIPASITTIPIGAFQGCSYLNSATLPATLTSIAANAFKDCPKLVDITIPDKVATIGDTAFSFGSVIPSATRTITFLGDAPGTVAADAIYAGTVIKHPSGASGFAPAKFPGCSFEPF